MELKEGPPCGPSPLRGGNCERLQRVGLKRRCDRSRVLNDDVQCAAERVMDCSGNARIGNERATHPGLAAKHLQAMCGMVPRLAPVSRSLGRLRPLSTR